MPEEAGIRAAGISGSRQAPALPSPRLPPPARRSRLAFRPAAGLPGCRPWAGLSGPAAMRSGRAGLHGGDCF